MSEQINNREYRKEVIKQIISELHAGKTVDEVKKKFEEAFKGVTASEISEAEQALIAEGLPISEVQRLCDVHAAVFKGSIEEIHQPVDKTKIPGHPANIIKRENNAIQNFIDKDIASCMDSLSDKNVLKELADKLGKLSGIDLHYLKKENVIFPYMEKYGITGPPKVMWGVDDEIRADLKKVLQNVSAAAKAPTPHNSEELKQEINSVMEKITEMIFKEENIMLPMLLEMLTQDEWVKIARDMKEIGFIVGNVPEWNPTPESIPEEEKEAVKPGIITMPTGVFKMEELVHALNTLPFDITFVDKDDVVKYYSESAERIFPRSKAIIGRKVTNCHPPASVHIVEKIVEDLKNGKKDHEDFWINMGGRFVLIRYYAVRNEKGEYLGTMEVTQDIKPLQEIKGEKRLVSE